jgi:hypothetical protein
MRSALVALVTFIAIISSSFTALLSTGVPSMSYHFMVNTGHSEGLEETNFERIAGWIPIWWMPEGSLN